MIIIKVWGGLGNQIFQYALYRYYKEIGVDVSLDINIFDYMEIHNGYELHKILKNPPRIATNKEIDKLAYVRKDIKSKIKRKIFKQSKKHYIEKEFRFYPEILNLKDAYLEGYWQSEKYFKNISTIIKDEIKWNFQLSNREIKILEDIKNNNSVSIHVRRGDYISNNHTASIHNVIKDLSYYKKAIKYIHTIIEEPKFYIFSNDPIWVKENLKLENCEIIDWNQGENSYKDMFFMSKCKHNIIANSSFSWWGAWLNDNSDKIVISPNKWFNSIEAPDVICDNWIKLNVD